MVYDLSVLPLTTVGECSTIMNRRGVPMTRRQPTSIRFTDEDMERIQRLMKHYGVLSVTSIVQMSIRALEREAARGAAADSQSSNPQQ